jgi:hypothetical protein
LGSELYKRVGHQQTEPRFALNVLVDRQAAAMSFSTPNARVPQAVVLPEHACENLFNCGDRQQAANGVVELRRFTEKIEIGRSFPHTGKMSGAPIFRFVEVVRLIPVFGWPAQQLIRRIDECFGERERDKPFGFRKPVFAYLGEPMIKVRM